MRYHLPLALLLLFPTLAQAHWAEHPDLPAWSQRGELRWCLHYSRADRKLVDLFLDHDQTLLHGGSFDGPETAEFARAHGLGYMPYVCSRTTTVQEIEKNPQLKGMVVVQQGGDEFLAYNNPVRRYGSLFGVWPEFVQQKTQRVWDLPDTVAIFYDNAFFAGDDHNPLAVAAWRKWATQHGLEPGTDVPPLQGDPLSAASRLFAAESLTEYHRGLQQFCHSHQPPLLNCPNLGSGSGAGLAAIEAGAVDMVFYETMTHPPFANNLYLYKVGLAASHGKPTGMLAYLPPAVGDQRGEKTWHEGMHSFFYPSSPLPEEFALAAAEGAAAGGSYIPCYNLFPSLPITDLSDPFNQRIYRALKQSYDFLKTNEKLYAQAQPGSRTVILYSTLAALHNRRLQNGEALADALVAAGTPFEVAVTSDLPDGLLADATLLIPNLAYLDAGTAGHLGRHLERGGRAIISGEFGTLDPVGRRLDAPAVRQIKAAIGLVQQPIRSWNLEGMEAEGPEHVRVTQDTGAVSLKFPGAGGRYIAYLSLNDENDGASPFTFSVAGKPVLEGKLDADDQQTHLIKTPEFAVAQGEELRLTIHADSGEMGRLYAIVLVKAAASSGAALGRGAVQYFPAGLETLGGDSLRGLLRPQIALETPGKVSINVTATAAQRLTAVHLLNYDFRYDVARLGVYAGDDGRPEARTFFGDTRTVLRKRLQIAAPQGVVEPVLQVYGFAVPGTVAEFPITINGQAAGSFNADQFRGSGWVELALDPKLLQRDNVIEMAARGDLDGKQKWLQVSIDTSTHAGGSEFSTDGGKTFSGADLSPDRQEQTGEYLIRIVDRSPGVPKGDPLNLVRNPGFEQVKTAHSETKLTVAPARDVVVRSAAKVEAALAISPEHEPVWVQAAASGTGMAYHVPEVSIYTVLLLGPKAALERVRQAQLPAATWALPPVTEPLRASVAAWDAWAEGFELRPGEGRGGGNAISCRNEMVTDLRGAVQQLDFSANPPARLTVTAWSRCRDASGGASADYSLYVDATCTDGAVFNGHATPFAAGTHDWQQETLRLEPPVPLKTVRAYVLFRKKTGEAWFDDVTVRRD